MFIGFFGLTLEKQLNKYIYRSRKVTKVLNVVEDDLFGRFHKILIKLYFFLKRL